MKISALIGGGLGDMIMSMRYLGAIKERYPDSFVSLYANDKGISAYSSFIKNHWSYLFDEFVVVEISSLNYKIRSQFGEEEYYNAYNNITEEYRKKIESADKFYNLISDGLFFLDYHDIPWSKYHRFIPAPTVESPLPQDGRVVLNLYARQDCPSFISKSHSDLIIESIMKTQDVIILSPSEEVKNSFYSKFHGKVVVATLDDALRIIHSSRIGVSIDTGIRCLFHSFGKECYTLSVNCNNFFQCLDAHKIRWYPWIENLIPLHIKPEAVSRLVSNALLNSACGLMPHIDPNIAESRLIRRRYD